MHTLTIHKDFEWSHGTLARGRYHVEDHNAAALLWQGRGFGNVELHHSVPIDPIPLPEVRKGDEIQVVRCGGFGDLLWLNAIYAEIRRQFPGIRIAHACFPEYASVLLGYVDRVLPYPLPEGLVDPDRLWWLENLIEGQPCVGTEHPCDRMARRFGLEPLARKAAYDVTRQEKRTAQKRWEKARKRWKHKDGRKRVCIQVESSSGRLKAGDTGNKTYPQMDKVMQALWSYDLEILVVGAGPQVAPKIPEGIYFGPGENLTMRESIAMAAECDVILANDSAFVHVGAALDIPVVGLFGPFAGEAYMQGQRGTFLQGKKSCSPCGWHPRGAPFPPGKSCEESRQCDALAMINPLEVAMAVTKLL